MTTLPINPESVIARSRAVVAAEIDGDLVMMSIEQGKYFGISGIGTRAWALLEQPTTIDTLCSRLVAEFDVDPATCRTDMLAFADKLLVLGLVDFHNHPSTP